MSTVTPGIEAQRAYYDERWALDTHANLLQLRRAVCILDGLRRLGLVRPTILDLGCGAGWLTTILNRFGPTTGIDLSPVAIANAQARYPDVRFTVADVSNFYNINETFDVIVSQEVIEHLEDQRGYINRAAQLLNPSGHLLLTTPNAWNLEHWTATARENWGLQPVEKWLTTKQLRALLSPQFRIICLRTLIVGFGTNGVFRIANSPKLLRILGALRVSRFYESALEKTGFGLHIFVIAQRT